MRKAKKDPERLDEAIKSNNTQTVLDVLKEAVDPKHCNEALMTAAMYGYNNSIVALLMRGANPEYVNSSGHNALSLAILRNHALSVWVLLRKANLKRILLKLDNSPYGISPLMYAIRLDRPCCAEMLIRGGAKLDELDVTGRYTPLMYAVEWNPTTAIIDTLLAAGARPEQLSRPKKGEKMDAITLAWRKESYGVVFQLSGLCDPDATSWLQWNFKRALWKHLDPNLPATRFYMIYWMLSSAQVGLTRERIDRMIPFKPENAPQKAIFFHASQNIKRIIDTFPLDFDAAYIWHTIPGVRFWLLALGASAYVGLPHERILFWIIIMHQKSNNLYLRQNNNTIPRLTKNMISSRYFKYLTRDYASLLKQLEIDFNPNIILKLATKIEDHKQKIKVFVLALKITHEEFVFIRSFLLLKEYCGLAVAKMILPDELQEDDGIIHCLIKFSFDLSLSNSDSLLFRKFYYFSIIHAETFNQCTRLEDLMTVTNLRASTWDEIKKTFFRGIKLITESPLRNLLLGSLVAIELGEDNEQVKIATLFDVISRAFTKANPRMKSYECIIFLYNNCDFFTDEANSFYSNEEFRRWVSYFSEQLSISQEALPATLNELIEADILLPACYRASNAN